MKRRTRLLLSLVALTAAGVALSLYLGWAPHRALGLRELPEAAGGASGYGYEVRLFYPEITSSDRLVYDLRSARGNARRVDAIHAFADVAGRITTQPYREVILATAGQERFRLSGEYVRELGQTGAGQNGVYTVRTFPQHVQRMTGELPWPAPSGGWLGVLGVEMQNVNAFLDEWLRGLPQR